MIRPQKDNILKFLAIFLVAANLLLMSWLHQHAGSMWGWSFTDFADGHAFTSLDAVAIFQFVLLAMAADVFMRWFVGRFNAHSKKTQIPAILVQCFSIFIYVMFGLSGFILLLDHSANYLLAASGAIGLSIGYVCRDLISDVVNSIVIQTDRLIAINDWIEVTGSEKPLFYQVIQFDRRMVTLKDKYDYLLKVPNTRFMGMSYINLSKQKAGRGSRRQLEIQLDSLNNSEKVIEILNLVLEAIYQQNASFVHTYNCGVGRIAEGSVTYKIVYECLPNMSLLTSESIVMRMVLRFLNAAEVNTGSSMEVQTLDKYLSKTSNRLLEVYKYSILKALSHEEAIKLSQSALIIHCFKGEQLIHYGDIADSMFLVSEGSLEVKIKGKDDQLISAATLWPGDCVGEMSLLTGAPRSADVYARVDSVLVEIKKEHIAPILESNKRLIPEISGLLTIRQAKSQTLSSIENSDGLRERSDNLAKRIINFFFRGPA